MAQYPRTESSILLLAESMIAGFKEHPEIFIHANLPLVEAVLDEYKIAKEQFVDNKAQTAISAKIKRKKISRLNEILKQEIKLSQVDCSDAPAYLETIGWGSRKKPSKNTKPAQPRELKVIAISGNTVFLKWKKPSGKNNSANCQFLIERRQQLKDGRLSDWELAGATLNTELKVKKQPSGKLEYRVKMANKSGESRPSNTVMVVL